MNTFFLVEERPVSFKEAMNGLISKRWVIGIYGYPYYFYYSEEYGVVEIEKQLKNNNSFGHIVKKGRDFLQFPVFFDKKCFRAIRYMEIETAGLEIKPVSLEEAMYYLMHHKASVFYRDKKTEEEVELSSRKDVDSITGKVLYKSIWRTTRTEDAKSMNPYDFNRAILRNKHSLYIKTTSSSEKVITRQYIDRNW